MKIRREELKIDAKKCNACHKCTTACSMKHYGMDDPRLSKIQILQFDDKEFNVPVICMACESPMCIDVCPMNARVRRPNGTIVTDRASCIGCRACLYICPVGSPVANPLTNQSMTCDLCEDDPEGPQCVKACHEQGALTISGIDEQTIQIARQQAGRMRRIFS